MKKLLTLALTLLLVIITVSCDKDSADASVKLSIDERPFTDFIGKRFGLLDGTGYETIVEDVFETDDYIVYTSNDDGRTLLQNGVVDALIGDYTASIPWLSVIGPAEYALTAIPAEYASFGYAAMSKSHEAAESLNKFLETLIADGTLDEMAATWVEGYDPQNIPTIEDRFTPTGGNSNGNLIVGINSECAPFVMPDKNGNPTGFEIELMTRFADSQGKSIVFEDLPFSDMMPYYTSGQADYITAMCYEISDNESSGIIFSDSYYEARLALIYKK